MADRPLPPSRSPGTTLLVGRERETVTVQELVADIPGTGAALCVRGAAGLGKTALLHCGSRAARERGYRVLWAEGVRSETALQYSALAQLLWPVRAVTARLHPDVRLPLTAALGYEEPTPDPESVGEALSVLLRHVPEPVLVVVDNLQWVDPASARAVQVLLDRFAIPHAGLLFAHRPGSVPVDTSSLAQCRLSPLEDPLARYLVRREHPQIPEPALASVVALAAGNPLALLELAAVADGPDETRGAAAGAHPRLPHRLRRLWADPLRELPASVRQDLLVAALSGEHPVPPMQPGRHSGHLQAAQDVGLVEVDPDTGGIAFAAPLVRSAVIAESTAAARRSAHRTLAMRVGPGHEQYAHHVAAAALAPDEAVAELLDDAARRLLRRGDIGPAAEATVRAAQLSTDTAHRVRRLAQAAYLKADRLGSLDEASLLLDRVRRVDPEAFAALPAAHAAAYVVANQEGNVEAAHRLLAPAIGSWAAQADRSVADLTEALHTLLQVCLFSGRDDLWTALLTSFGQAHLRQPLLELCVDALADPVRTAAAARPRLDRAVAAVTTDSDSKEIERVAMATLHLDAVDLVDQPLVRLVRGARAGTSTTSGILAMTLLACQSLKRGQWEEADRWASEASDLCRARGYLLYSPLADFCRAMVAAGRGDEVGTAGICADMLAWGVPRGIRAVQVYAAQAQTVCALGAGRYGDAYAHATSVCEPGAFPPHRGWMIWSAMDVVEAATLSHHQAEAVAHVQAMQREDLASLSSRAALVVAGSQALASAGLDRDLFELALATPQAGRWPFEVARIELRYGQRLRRARHFADARAHLAAALEMFEGLHATGWAAQARAELLATTPSRSGAPAEREAPLTQQEWVVARLAAEGLTNKAIADRLQISHRTVSAHLHHVFVKLHIETRAALPDALAPFTTHRPLAGRQPVGAGAVTLDQPRRGS